MICFVALRFANGRYLRSTFVATWVCVGLLWLQCLLGLAGLGDFVIPPAVLLTIGASRASRGTTDLTYGDDEVRSVLAEQPG